MPLLSRGIGFVGTQRNTSSCASTVLLPIPRHAPSVHVELWIPCTRTFTDKLTDALPSVEPSIRAQCKKLRYGEIGGFSWALAFPFDMKSQESAVPHFHHFFAPVSCRHTYLKLVILFRFESFDILSLSPPLPLF